MTDPRFTENFDGTGHVHYPEENMPATSAPAAAPTPAPASTTEGVSRHNTLKKRNSVKRKSSVKGTLSSRPGTSSSTRDFENKNSIFYTPVPTKSYPTDTLAERFASWRDVLKQFIAYFRQVQAQYEARANSIAKVTSNLVTPSNPGSFLTEGGILESYNILQRFHGAASSHSQYAARIESEIIRNLVGLRNDLKQKISEIKGLKGDFSNGLDKDKEAMKKEVLKLQDELEAGEMNPVGGKDPYITRLAVEKKLRHYLDEENYLHRAYLNLESSGRELERIVVVEIQKAYNSYADILASEGQQLLDASQSITANIVDLPPDREWNHFVSHDPKMVAPDQRLRTFEDIEYPGYQHSAAVEIKSGTLERKSKYLKSFTPAWYVLSPTHLHEFKSPDRIRDTTPVMSLYLRDSTLGKHSEPGAVSHKFVLKGKQTGAMHRGHSWVFRAETHEAMLEWYEAITRLTEGSGEERQAFVVGVANRQRALSSASRKTDSGDLSGSEGGFEDDAADEVPYSGQPSEVGHPKDSQESLRPPVRPEGGRFPSDIDVNRYSRNSQRTLSESSEEAIANAAAMPGAENPYGTQGLTQEQPDAPAQNTAVYMMSGVTAHDSGYQNVQYPPAAYSPRDETTTEQNLLAANTAYNTNPAETYNNPRQDPEGNTVLMVGAPVTQTRSKSPTAWSAADNNSNYIYEQQQTSQLDPAAIPRPLQNVTTFSQQRVPLAAGGSVTEPGPLAHELPASPPIEQPPTPVPGSLGFVHPKVTGAAFPPHQGEESAAAAWAHKPKTETLAAADRPTSIREQSDNTISNLHIPGEYPKKTTV